MTINCLIRAARYPVLLASALGLAGLTAAQAGNPPAPVHFSGLLNDYTPSAALVKGGPYEMRGKWQLDLDQKQGVARFSAELNMETSDFGIAQGTVDKDDPTTRGAHTHHISMSNGVVSSDWQSFCPVFSPAATGGFVVTGTAFITGNGSPAPFGNPSPLTLCVLGGSNVVYSNITLVFGLPASKHFGVQPVHGVVQACAEPWGRESPDCSLDE